MFDPVLLLSCYLVDALELIQNCTYPHAQVTAAKLAEASRRAAQDAAARADSESTYQEEMANLRRSGDDNLKRAHSEAALQIDQAQATVHKKIAAVEAQVAQDIVAIEDEKHSLELRVGHLMDQARESEELHTAAVEKMAKQATDACSQVEANAAAEIARVRSELTEALDILDQRDADDELAQSRVAEIEEEAVLWKRSAEESFAATLSTYRDKMEGTVTELEHQLALVRDEAQQNAERANQEAQAVALAERRAARKVRRQLTACLHCKGCFNRRLCLARLCSLPRPTQRCTV
jgi:hypothetical protein